MWKLVLVSHNTNRKAAILFKKKVNNTSGHSEKKEFEL